MNLGVLKLSGGKRIEIFLWLAALGVLVENVSLYRQNRSLQEAVAPQIAAGTQLHVFVLITQVLGVVGVEGAISMTGNASTLAARDGAHSMFSKYLLM